ncbi:glycosyltransferase family 1 protein [Scytonema sp. UIC 10036]|uniref:glycosyltransferase family 1 protein n=1 Tax=Scytonema sp. UIC 10036 TaxID=2304196 RepID=UPI0012DAD330|nr:glycosyltransferase family 1 protein [Scytonema sp. UIC 10036]MUG98011.1 glycosyltransferase family 1 protein [Scytonema sp. UIC 10036]
MNVIFASAIGRFPIGGNAWSDLQYLLGLRSLGHNVFYLEECGSESWVYNWESEQLTTELDYPTNYVKNCLEPLGFENQWIYRAGDRSVGMEVDAFRDICSQADLMIVRGSPISLWREEYKLPKRRIYIDADPGFTQINIACGHRELINTIEHCDRLFTIGQRIGAGDCLIPTIGKHWLKTLPPVALSYWPVTENDNSIHFSSIMQWHSYREVVYEGVTYGNKDKEFLKFIDLPQLTKQPFRIALSGGFPNELSQYGWEVLPGWIASFTPDSYQKFVQESRAEFGVAKQGYVATKGGWFSDRSVCYLASGKPVLVQDTGLRDWLPIGEGILTFCDQKEALKGTETINADCERHQYAARQLAEEYFNSDKVLSSLLEAAMN